MRPYKDRKDSVIGTRIDVDNFPEWGKYQCVDLFKHYCKELLGIPYAKTGNANEIRENKFWFFDSTWTKIPGTDDLMQWDIIISTKLQYWHIAIFDHRTPNGKIFVIEQNWSGRDSWSWTGENAIREWWYFPTFWAGVRRCPKIFENRKSEMDFVRQKINSLNKEKLNTEQYANSTLYRVKN